METPEVLEASHFESESREQILSNLPLISSHKLNLLQVKFDYYKFNEYETPRHCHIHHVIGTTFENTEAERRLDGVFQTENHVFGSTGIVPANVEHWMTWKKPIEFSVISIHHDFLAYTAYEFVNPDKVELIPTFAQPDYFISGISLAIKHELTANFYGCKLLAESLFHQLAVHLLGKYTTYKLQIKEYDGLAPYKLKQILDLIGDSLREEVSIAQMASFLDMSQFHFCREFKKSLGVTPHHYIMQQRVKMAKRILKQQKLSIAQVAVECGFSNQSHLGRVFKQHTGTTPRRFRLGSK